jgi:N-acetyl-alpha-D-muramate 1-phosphate uridylyltransferase
MKAMILAAGRGTRLGKITEHRPKCLVEVGGAPIVRHVLDRLLAGGATALAVNLHHEADSVRKFFQDQRGLEVPLSFSYEPELLDTGGAIKKVRHFFTGVDPFMVHNCDVFHRFDLRQLLQCHVSQGNLVTLATMRRETDRVLVFSQAGELLGWRNRRSGVEKLVRSSSSQIEMGYCGIQVLSSRIFEYMPVDREAFSIVDIWLAAAETGERVGSCAFEGLWCDIGTPQALESLRARLAQHL